MAQEKQDHKQWRTLLLPVLTIIGGFGVYFLLFRILVDPFNPDMGALSRLDPVFLWDIQESETLVTLFAQELEARYKFAIPSVLMSLVFVAALIVAFGMVLPQFGRFAIGLGIVALPAGALIGLIEQYNNPIRAAVADCPPDGSARDCPLDHAVASMPEGWLFTSRALDQIQFLVSYNSAISVAAITLIGICALFVARTVPAHALDADYLNRRRRGLETMLALVGPLLVFSVATTHGFYHFSASMMEEESAEAYALLASSGTMYWGAVYTTVLIVVTAPAIASVVRDGRRASVAALPDGTFADRQDWRKRHGVELPLREKLRLAASTLAPVLTTPALDLLRRAVE